MPVLDGSRPPSVGLPYLPWADGNGVGENRTWLLRFQHEKERPGDSLPLAIAPPLDLEVQANLLLDFLQSLLVALHLIPNVEPFANITEAGADHAR